jgi:hypothetical protein
VLSANDVAVETENLEDERDESRRPACEAEESSWLAGRPEKVDEGTGGTGVEGGGKAGRLVAGEPARPTSLSDSRLESELMEWVWGSGEARLGTEDARRVAPDSFISKSLSFSS